MLEFRLLGPFEVVADGRPLPPLAPKLRALLVALLLRGGQVVSRERLVDDVWGEEPPASVIASLENAVSGLRKALGPDIVVTRPPGYAVAIDPEQVDVLRFQQLVARARDADAEERATRLRQALALFRGPPLPDRDLGPFAEAEGARLAELELAVREELIAAEIELGRHAEVLSDVERLVAENPYRERLRAQLMLGLYRSGRQSDALAAYRLARQTLVDELGTEPGEELRELHRAILRQDPALRAPVDRTARPSAGTRPTRKTVTVLACNLSDWATVAERLDAERLHALLDRYTATARATVRRHGGTIDAVAGDGVTAVFGIPTVHEDDAVRALRAAAELRAEVEGLTDGGLALALHGGVDTGEVLVDPDGPALAVGAAVGHAQELARAAEPGEILVAEATHWLARDAVALDSVQRPSLGARTALCYRLVDAAPDRAGRTLRLDSPLVGREDELAELEAALDRVEERRACGLVTIVGPAGVGKSRVVREFVGAIAGRATVLRARCAPGAEGAAAWPLVETAEGGETPLLDALGVDAGAESEGATHHAVRGALESLARDRPLVAALDDLQWAAPALLDLVESVLDVSSGAPILILCTARPELLSQRAAWAEASSRSNTVRLEPLDEAQSERLIDNLLGEADLPDPVIAHLVRSAGGYPLFVEELLATLVEQAVLRRVGGRWTTSEMPALKIPPTVKALIAARLDRLPEAERVVLEIASVQGTRFSEDAVAALAPEDFAGDISEQIATLAEKDIVRREGTAAERFVFRHDLVRDAAYESIPKRVRARLHDRFADWLAEQTGRVQGRDDVVRHHRDQAGLLRRELGVERSEQTAPDAHGRR